MVFSDSPDEPHKVYVGTDYGVALSRDNGNTWSHIMLYTNEPIWGVNGIAEPKMQNSVISLLTLPDKKVIALTGTGVYRTDDDELWRRIRQGNFAHIWNLSCKNIDVSSRDSDKVFILQDYSKLLFYEVADEKWTQIDLPGGSGRGPFVRVSNSSSSDTSIDIWVGTGVNLLKTTCSDVQSVTRLNASSWNTLDWANGIHPDTGYLALDNDKRPLLYGSDGGIFRYTHNATWTGINTGRTGTNSHLITDLAGTNVRLASGIGYNTTLYFATQDNDIWASSDGGNTWPNSDSTEGYCIQVRQDATSDREARVGYVKIRVPRFSDDVNLSRSRDVPNVDINNKPLSNMSQAFFVSPNKWIRYRALRNGETQVYISTNNGNNWRRRAIVKLEEMGFISASGDPSNPVIYMPLKAA